MRRLTTDNPQNNTDAARNLFFVKDGEAWVRRGSPEPDYPDISLLSFTRRILATYGIHLEELDDQELSNELFDMLFYGPETTGGLIALLYSAGWAFAELRAHLKHYEDLEEAGRLVTLPCNPKDTVFLIESVYEGRKKVGEEVVEAEIDRFIIADGKGPVADVCSDGGGWYEALEPKDFFRTREEAVAAMLLQEQDGHG